MLRGDEFVRDHVSERIRGVVDRVVAEHALRLTQEAQITSRIAEAIESGLSGFEVDGYVVRAIAQEIPDRGRGSLEKQSGTDLYIGIEVINEMYPSGFRKGTLVQGKLFEAMPASEMARLRAQCEKMESLSRKGAFVWFYSSTGVRVTPASDVLATPILDPRDLSSRNLGEHFRDIFDCVAGDWSLASSTTFEGPQALNQWLSQTLSKNGVVISLQREPFR